jgi:hypothetical protein
MKEQQPEWYFDLKNDPLPTRTFNKKNIENIEQRSKQTINNRNEKGRHRLQWIAYLGVIFAVLILAVTIYNGAIPVGINQSINTPITQTQSPSTTPSPNTQVFNLKGEVGVIEQPSFMYGSMPPKFVADPNIEYRIIGRDGSFVQIMPNATGDQQLTQLTGWIPEWYLSSDGSTKIEKVEPYELIVAETVSFSLHPEEPVPSGFPLDVGKVVQVTGRFDKWLRVNIKTYDSPCVGDKWVLESALENWDPEKAMEGYLKVNAKVYDETGKEMDAPNYSNPIRINAKQGDKYMISSTGGYTGVIAKQDFVPNPFKADAESVK